MTNVRIASYFLAVYVRWLIVLLFASFLISSLIAGIMGEGEDFLNRISLPVLLLISPLFMYIKARGERSFTKAYWSNPDMGRPAKFLLIGHLGFAYCVIALSAMTIGKSGSGIALLPGLLWMYIFYSKGFKFLHASSPGIT